MEVLVQQIFEPVEFVWLDILKVDLWLIDISWIFKVLYFPPFFLDLLALFGGRVLVCVALGKMLCTCTELIFVFLFSLDVFVVA